MIRLFITDDHKIILDGFVSILQDSNQISLMGTAQNGEELLVFLESNTVDVVLLDINMPVLSGVEACKIISKKYPETKVIALSMFKKASYVKRMKQNGASGYLLKNDSSEEIIKAIHTVYEGGEYYSNALKEVLMHNLFDTEEDTILKLTKRESQVLQLISEGFSNKEISKKITLSSHTIDSYRKSLLSKFNARNTADLIKKAIDKGMI